MPVRRVGVNRFAEEPDVELIMNQPSVDFLSDLQPGGLITYNESLIDKGVDREDVKKIGIPATVIADELKRGLRSQVHDTRNVANAVMFGAFLELFAPQISDDQIKESLKHFLAVKKGDLMQLNYVVITKGRAFVHSNLSVGISNATIAIWNEEFVS